VSAYITVDGAAAAIEFYKSVLGATERGRLPGPDGRIGHADLTMGDSLIMLSDAFPDMGVRDPKDIGGTPVTLSVYVEDVDDVFARALAAGATEQRPVQNQFYGDRSGQFVDPWGHRWNVASRVENVSPEGMERRAAAMGSH
jgi:PhnB protein